MFISANNILIKKWWAIFVLINAILVVCTIAYPHLPDFPQKWRIITPFSLHGEMSIAVWWSGITLLLAALLCFDRYRNNSESDKLSWLSLSLVMAGLSLDEIGSFHERISLISGWSGMVPFALIIFCLIIYSVFSLYKTKDTKKNALYILIAFTVYGSVALQEFMEHLLTWPIWLTGLRVGIEEGCELLGTFLIIYAAIYKKAEHTPKNIFSLFPTLNTMHSLKYIAVICLVIHVIGSYIFLQLNIQDERGNPMIWYPAAILFCAFIVCLWNSTRSESSGKIGWNFLLIACLLSSIGVMSQLFIILLPGIENIISTKLIEEKYVLHYLLQLLIAGILAFKLLLIKNSVFIASCTITIGLVLTSIFLDSLWLRYSMLGICSCYIYLLALQPIFKTNIARSPR